MIQCGGMAEGSLLDGYDLITTFLTEDRYYLGSSHAYGGAQAAGVCVVSYAISTSVGTVVAKMDDLFVATARQGRGVGSKVLVHLKSGLRRLGIVCTGTRAHLEDGSARRCYLQNGFQALHEDRLACVLG